MKQILIILSILALISCGDDFENCQTCRAEVGSETITSEYCQDGANVQSTVDGVQSVIENTTVEAVVATQAMLAGVTCN